MEVGEGGVGVYLGKVLLLYEGFWVLFYGSGKYWGVGRRSGMFRFCVLRRVFR